MDGYIILAIIFWIVSLMIRKSQMKQKQNANDTKTHPAAAAAQQKTVQRMNAEQIRVPLRTAAETAKSGGKGEAPAVHPEKNAEGSSLENAALRSGLSRAKPAIMQPSAYTEMSERNTVMDSSHQKKEAVPAAAPVSTLPLAFTRDAVLQGVVMSEILTRPQMRRGRRNP